MTTDDETTDPAQVEAPVAPAAPVVVVHGEATAEQLAALVAVLSAASGGDEPASGPPFSPWAAHTASMRPPVSHGPGAWRTSLRS